MPFAEMVLGIVVLLLTPGPTNTLMALAGAERGVRRAATLIAAELGGYLAVVVPLAVAGAGLIARVPGLVPLVTAVAAAWVLWLAVHMWRQALSAPAGAATVTAMGVFVTTLLNPKGLIIGLVLLPGQPLAWRIVVFAGLVAGAAAVWICLGAALARRGGGQTAGLPPQVRRAGALVLGLLSAALAYRAALA